MHGVKYFNFQIIVFLICQKIFCTVLPVPVHLRKFDWYMFFSVTGTVPVSHENFKVNKPCCDH